MRYLAFFLLVICNLAFSQSVKTYIPPQAFNFKEPIRIELNTFFSNIPEYNYVPALIEHESCLNLKHKKCWSTVSELKTSREQGLGIFQITRTFRTDGSIRFDVLTEMRNKYKEHLKEASWDNFKYRPDLQVRMGVLMLRDNYKTLYNVKDNNARLHFTNAAHNTGIGNVNKKRRACGLSKDCDPQLWFGNAENECIGLTRVIYGTRSACDIVRDHTFDTFNNRLPKYKQQYFTEKDLRL